MHHTRAHYERRLATSLAASIGLHCGLLCTLLWLPRASRFAPQAHPGATTAARQAGSQSLLGVAILVALPAAQSLQTKPLPTQPAPTSVPVAPETATIVDESNSEWTEIASTQPLTTGDPVGSGPDAPPEQSATGGGGTSRGESTRGTAGPGSNAPGSGTDGGFYPEVGRLKLEIPAAVYKRKINGEVLLQARLAADGSIDSVRVLHSIPNCPECTESAVRCLQQYQFSPPATNDPAALWTSPFTLGFYSGR